MKSILVIAPQSFPVTATEAIVNIKLLRALSESEEFCIDLISKRNKWHDYPTGTLESYGVVLNSLNVIEVDNKVNIKTIWQSFLSLLLFGVAYKGCHWAVAARNIVVKLYKSKHYDYILTKDSPSLLLGYYLKRRFGAKWVATWNDPMPMVKYPYPYGRGLDNKDSLITKRIINIMRHADVQVTPSNRLKKYLNSYLNVGEKLVVVPHMVSYEENREIQYGHTLKMIHSGHLGYPRDPQNFLEGLALFRKRNTDARVQFDILGKTSEHLQEIVEKNALHDCVHIIPPMEYEKSLSVVSQYDIAVIIEAEQLEEGIFMPTKVSDFMQCATPIFAVSPIKGTLSDLYQNDNIPYFADVKSPINIAEELEIIYKAFESKALKHNVIPDDFKKESIIKQYLSF